MPEFCRDPLAIRPTYPIVPLLNEGEELPPGLTDLQRMLLTRGRLAMDFRVDILLKKLSIARTFGMSIKLVGP